MKKGLCYWMMVFFALSSSFSANGQPDYIPTELLTEFDTVGLKQKIVKENYDKIIFKMQTLEIRDIDESNTVPIKFNGVFLAANIVYPVMDDSTRIVECFVFPENKEDKFLISRQQYLDTIPNGKFESYSLKGKKVSEVNFKQGKKRGISRLYGLDGKKIIEETEYINDEKIIQREYFENGKMKQEFPLTKDKLNGTGRRYYETGSIMEEVQFTDGDFDGFYKYFHSNNQLWVHIEYKLGLPLNAIENYTANAEKREPGTLKNGNGTLIYYNEDGSISGIQHFENGKRVK